jgi:hypothetical protein
VAPGHNRGVPLIPEWLILDFGVVR